MTHCRNLEGARTGGSLYLEELGKLGSRISRYLRRYVNITLESGEKCTNVVWTGQNYTTSSTGGLERCGASK